MRRFAILAALLSASACADDTLYSNSYMGKAPPELAGGRWIHPGGAEKPITLAGLKGKVVFLEFGFLG